MNRLWKATLVLGLLLAGLWWQALVGVIMPLHPPYENFVYLAALVVLGFTLFAMLARSMSYVQAFHNHIRVVTPFLRLKVSYSRVRSVRPAEFHKLFPPAEAGWAERRFLEPFYPLTVVFVELSRYPLPRGLLRLFLPPQMFYPQSRGLVFVVEDWMALSTEIESFRGQWMETQKPARERVW